MSVLNLWWVWLLKGYVRWVEAFWGKNKGDFFSMRLLSGEQPSHHHGLGPLWFFFHSHQCNKLTGTNFYCCQHGIANMRVKHRAVCLLCFPWQLCSWAPRCRMRLDAGGEEVSGWFFGASWATWNTLFWSVNWASWGWDPLGLWSHVMPWLFMALICNESASPFPL